MSYPFKCIILRWLIWCCVMEIFGNVVLAVFGKQSTFIKGNDLNNLYNQFNHEVEPISKQVIITVHNLQIVLISTDWLFFIPMVLQNYQSIYMLVVLGIEFSCPNFQLSAHVQNCKCLDQLPELLPDILAYKK